MSIVTMRSRLSDADLRTLVKGVSDEERAQAAHKVCRAIDSVELTDAERAYAQEILQLLAQDAAELVRRALAVALKQSPNLPRDIAMRLAYDVDAVATPVIANSPSLTDSDLVEIIRALPPAKQLAAASRPTLSESVTDALSEFGSPAAVERALANDNAAFSSGGLGRVLERMSDRQTVTTAMALRKTLPVSITEKLAAVVTGAVFDHLVNTHELPPQLAIDLAIGARERATIDLVEQAARQRDLPRFCAQIHLHGRLTPSLIMRALCLGHMTFVEHALAELSGLPHHRVWLMMHDSGPLGLNALFDRASLPQRIMPAFRAAIDVFHELERNGIEAHHESFRRHMVERVLTLFQHVPRDDLNYLLEKLDAIDRQPKLDARARPN